MTNTSACEWITTTESRDGSLSIQSLAGIPWSDAPVPHWWHRCTPQTKGYTNYFDQVYRCACGAISRDAHHWHERNSRKTS